MPSTPLTCLYIYLTDSCNLRCTHCWQGAPVAGTADRFLHFDECRRFLVEAVKLGLRNVTMSGGEPLLSPEFPAFAEYLFCNNIQCNLETNGILISGSRLEAIKRFSVFCCVSVDGASAETHNRQRGRTDAFVRTLEGLEHLEAESIRYQVIMTVSQLNYADLVPLADLLRARFPHCCWMKINIVQPTGRGQQMAEAGVLFEPTDLPRIVDDVAAMKGRYPFPIVAHVDPAFTSLHNLRLGVTCGGRCGHESALSVLADGSVSICSLGKLSPQYVFGHVGDLDLSKLWGENPLLRMIHNDGHLKLKGVCSRCLFRRRCAGSCRAKALLVYDDVFGPAPTCQRYYELGQFPSSLLVRPEESCGVDVSATT